MKELAFRLQKGDDLKVCISVISSFVLFSFFASSIDSDMSFMNSSLFSNLYTESMASCARSFLFQIFLSFVSPSKNKILFILAFS